jgi:hypothetical protein
MSGDSGHPVLTSKTKISGNGRPQDAKSSTPTGASVTRMLRNRWTMRWLCSVDRMNGCRVESMRVPFTCARRRCFNSINPANGFGRSNTKLNVALHLTGNSGRTGLLGKAQGRSSLNVDLLQNFLSFGPTNFKKCPRTLKRAPLKLST